MNIHFHLKRFYATALSADRYYLFLLLTNLLLVFLIIYTLIQNSYQISMFYATEKTIKKVSSLPLNMPISFALPEQVWTVFGVPLSTLTPESFTIVGIQYSPTNTHMTHVLIETQNQTKSYGIGSRLSQGAIVTSIQPNEVILLHNGSLKKIIIDWNH